MKFSYTKFLEHFEPRMERRRAERDRLMEKFKAEPYQMLCMGFDTLTSTLARLYVAETIEGRIRGMVEDDVVELKKVNAMLDEILRERAVQHDLDNGAMSGVWSRAVIKEFGRAHLFGDNPAMEAVNRAVNEAQRAHENEINRKSLWRIGNVNRTMWRTLDGKRTRNADKAASWPYDTRPEVGPGEIYVRIEP